MKIAFLGDILFNGKYDCTRDGLDAVLDRLACFQPIFAQCDYVVGNLEGPFTRSSTTNEHKTLSLKNDPANIQLLLKLGINVVTLANMDVFLMPSLYEGLPIVAIEAQAMGLPVICSPAIPEDAKISDRIAFLDLKDSAVSWAKAIVAQKGAARSPSDNTCIKNNGFAIADVASSLADFYLRQWSKYTSDT